MDAMGLGTRTRASGATATGGCLQSCGDFLAGDFSYAAPPVPELEHDVISTCAHPFTLLGGISD